jgi:hypothetical protein
MGMYDEYEPVPQPRCPWCEAGFSTHWQGKDGPNLLLVWRQGERHPVDQSIDEDARMERERYAEFVLPEEFTILGECDNGHFVTARGRCVGGVWRELNLSEERAKVEEKAWRDRQRRWREARG